MGVIACRSLSLQERYQKSRKMSDTEDVPVKSPAARKLAKSPAARKSAKSPAAKSTKSPAAKAAAKKSAAKAVQGQASSHPKYADMVATTIEAIASRGGCSRQAILKKIKEDFDVGDNERRVAINVNMTLKKGVESGKLKMAREKGKGAGSYKLGEKPKPEKKKPAKRLSGITLSKKKAAAKKTPSKNVKKSGTASKTAAKKTPSK